MNKINDKKVPLNSWKENEIQFSPFGLAVVIGRFQPVHNGHLNLFKKAANLSENVLILVGSSFIAPDSRNPFTFEERAAMIKAAVSEDTKTNFIIKPIVDDLYNDNRWLADIQKSISEALCSWGISSDEKIALVGHHKDSTSYYLDLFPKPKYNFFEVDSEETISSTDIRRSYFIDNDMGIFTKYFMIRVPNSVTHYLLEWKKNFPTNYNNIKEEFLFLDNYKKQFSSLIYPPIFVTTDAVVICNGHILLVKRRSHPGKGLWALPGGFLGKDEKIEDSMVRELVEETKILKNAGMNLEFVKKSLKPLLKGIHVFDAPTRSLRGRTITHAGLFILEQTVLPDVVGSDDAEKAKWFPISDLYSMHCIMFEDHWSIAIHMINKI